jgi:chaperonin GroES
MKYRPLGDRVVILRDNIEKQSAGGIHLPERSAEKSTKGEVLAVGPGHLNDDGTYTKLEVNVGDCVLFTRWAGSNVEIPGDDRLMIVREQELLAVIEG